MYLVYFVYFFINLSCGVNEIEKNYHETVEAFFCCALRIGDYCRYSCNALTGVCGRNQIVCDHYVARAGYGGRDDCDAGAVTA